jgi:hypothetical protein
MTLTRRDAIGLLGIGAGVSLASRLGLVAQGGPVIRTLLADVAPGTIDGPILFHEHLSIRYPLTKALADAQGRPVPVSYSDDVDLMIAEAKAAGADGVRCIVDGGHPDMDRDLDALKRIAAASGVHIVASGGFYMQRNYPADIAAKSADQIADDLARDAKAQRFGAFGEIGQQGGVLTDDEKKVFMAVAKAQVRTGLPIFTHNAYSGVRVVNPPIPMDAALKQLDVLEAAGADVKHVRSGMCCLTIRRRRSRGSWRSAGCSSDSIASASTRSFPTKARRDDRGVPRGRPGRSSAAVVGFRQRAAA